MTLIFNYTVFRVIVNSHSKYFIGVAFLSYGVIHSCRVKHIIKINKRMISRTIRITMGDFNARIGQIPSELEGVYHYPRENIDIEKPESSKLGFKFPCKEDSGGGHWVKSSAERHLLVGIEAASHGSYKHPMYCGEHASMQKTFYVVFIQHFTT